MIPVLAGSTSGWGRSNFPGLDGYSIDWPAQSPDLNPFEHLWDELEPRLRVRPNHPTSVPDFINALVAEWKQIPAAMF